VVLGWQWHWLDHNNNNNNMDHMQTICTSLQTDNHTNTSGWMLFLVPNQQCQNTEGTFTCEQHHQIIINCHVPNNVQTVTPQQFV